MYVEQLFIPVHVYSWSTLQKQNNTITALDISWIKYQITTRVREQCTVIALPSVR